jgi:Flp pilus assembly pilin Flp
LRHYFIKEGKTVKLLMRLVNEDSGAETVEYALVLALMALAAAAGVSTAGSQLGTWWNSLATTINSLVTSA